MSDDRVVQIESDADSEIRDWPELVGQLNRLLRLRTTPIGMKLFETVEEMEKIPRIRRPQAIHTTDQVVAQAARLGWTVGATREPSVSIPCFAERRYGGVLDDEMLLATPPEILPRAIAGMERLSANGLRYPIPQYGVQSDARAGMGASYGSR